MSMYIKKSKDYLIFQIIAFAVVTIVTLFTLVPFLLLVSGSITAESEIMKRGFSLIPRKFSIMAYKLIFKDPAAILNAYGVTTFATVVGTAAALFFTTMTAFVISRKDFRYRNALSFFYYLTMIFYAPLVVNYIYTIRYLHLKNNILVLVIGGILNAYYIFLMRNFIKTIPDAIIESAKIDGANDFYVFLKFIIPLSKPALASIGLFIALEYWNNWFQSMLYIENPKLFSLQYFLYKIINSQSFLKRAVSSGSGISINIEQPDQSLKMAMSMVVTGPIILLFPFIQKYFVKGLTLGAVKG